MARISAFRASSLWDRAAFDIGLGRLNRSLYVLSVLALSQPIHVAGLGGIRNAEIWAAERGPTFFHRTRILVMVGRPQPGHRESTLDRESDPLYDLEAGAASLGGISVGQRATQPHWRHRDRDGDVDPHLVRSSESLPIGRDFKIFL